MASASDTAARHRLVARLAGHAVVVGIAVSLWLMGSAFLGAFFTIVMIFSAVREVAAFRRRTRPGTGNRRGGLRVRSR